MQARQQKTINFRRGKKFEGKVARHLRSQGAMVFRTNWNQKDVDLIAIWGNDISMRGKEAPWLVQCKKDRLKSEERERLENLVRRFPCVKVKAAVKNEKGFIELTEITPTEIQLPPPPADQESSVLPEILKIDVPPLNDRSLPPSSGGLQA